MNVTSKGRSSPLTLIEPQIPPTVFIASNNLLTLFNETLTTMLYLTYFEKVKKKDFYKLLPKILRHGVHESILCCDLSSPTGSEDIENADLSEMY